MHSNGVGKESNFNDLKDETMTAKEFIEKEGLEYSLAEYDEGGFLGIDEHLLEQKLEEYHQAKLKLLGIGDVSHRNLKEPNRKAIDLIMLLEANHNLRYVEYPEGEDPADYPKRVLKGEGFADALRIVRDFYGG